MSRHAYKKQKRNARPSGKHAKKSSGKSFGKPKEQSDGRRSDGQPKRKNARRKSKAGAGTKAFPSKSPSHVRRHRSPPGNSAADRHI